ncbi:MAG: CBS domain-containing protein [Planctomycetota bacterium]|nr:CBS domain-containing protein [Planctomycetota bacterium]
MSSFTMPVDSFMTKGLFTVDPADTLEHAEAMMVDRRISSLPVVTQQGRIEGMITRSDLIRIGRRQAGMRRDASLLTFPKRTVASAMKSNLILVTPDMSVGEAARLMVKKRVHRVLVAEDRMLRGLFSTQDVMRVIEALRVTAPIHQYMSTPVFTVRSTEPLSLATDRLAKARISGLVVVEDSWPVGVFTQAEALIAHEMENSTPVEESMSPRFLSLAADTRLFRAAAQAAALGARRVLSMHGPRIEGLLSGLDFAKAAS